MSSKRSFPRPAFRRPSLLSARELHFFAGQVYFVLSAGFPVARGLSVIRLRGRTALLMPAIERAVQGGAPLHTAFESAGVFPAFFCAMTRVGEESGMLSEIMRLLEDYYDREARMAESLRNAMIYPAMVSGLMLCVIVASILFVIPGYAVLFETNGAQLPLATAALIGLSAFISAHGGRLAVVGLITALCARYFLSYGAGQRLTHRIKLCSKLYVKSINYRFAMALRLMLASGADLLRATAAAKNVVGNVIMDERLTSVLEHMVYGASMAAALEGVGHIDETLLTMLRLGEETGKPMLVITRCAEHLQRELDAHLARLNRLAEPIITLVLGAALVFVMLALMLPTFQMVNIL